MEPGFLQAQSDNLPRIDSFMLMNFIGQNSDFVGIELRGIKMGKSARENYGDNAIGYVQVKREDNICTVKGRITPEHNVRKKPYAVVVTCDEAEEVVLSVQCEDCAAALGGCKHAVAFLTWLHRRSEEPSTTDVVCYWKKPVLSSVGTSLKLLKVKDLKAVRNLSVPDGSFLASVVDHSLELGRTNTELTKYYKIFSDTEKMSVNHLIIEFLENVGSEENVAANSFFDFCKMRINVSTCKQAEVETRLQAECPLWHELKYCRVTASKAYEVMCCQTIDGTLVDSLLGAKKFKTAAMVRGSSLEANVLKEVEKKTGMRFGKCGLMVLVDHPILGASPDGISDEYVVEVKSPMTEKALKRYIRSDGEITARYMSQVQLQMHAFGKEKGLFCVANADFEISKNVNIITVSYNRSYCENMIQKCEDFWARSVFTILKKSYS